VLREAEVGTLDLGRLSELLEPTEAASVRDAATSAQAELAGRRIWNVNSTARGGGVAEMLVTLLAYARGAGVDARWLVIDGNPEFFKITKRIHNRLHGARGDGGPLSETERETYADALAGARDQLLERVTPADIVILHDPQTAGLAPSLREAGVPVIWRCHVGIDRPNGEAREAWAFLEPFVEAADVVVFSRREFIWDTLERPRRDVIAPSIDALSPKNQDLDAMVVREILRAARIRPGPPNGAAPEFCRFDGTRGLVRRRATLDEEAPLRPDDRFVLQVSRWDRLKDPLGVIEGFARHVAPHSDAHLIYAGPDVTAVSDDPEGADVLAAARELRSSLEPALRERVHLAILPMDDLEENAAIVNALQRDASVVVQKSLAEGFGLTVAEAMWKSRPVVASRIGGIADQIENGTSGVLLADPADMVAFGGAIRRLLEEPQRAAAMGAAARERVRARFLGTHSLLSYLDLIRPLAKGDHDRPAVA
jgi:trehalose synthase